MNPSHAKVKSTAQGTTPMPPKHVSDAFGVRGEAVAAGACWDYGWRFGDVVLSPVVDTAQAAWSAKIRESLAIPGVRVARPLRTTDGRHVLAGWQAREFSPGAPSPRADETIVTALAFDEACAQMPRPNFLVDPMRSIFATCEHAAWVPQSVEVLGRLLDPQAVPSPDAAEALQRSGQLLQLRSPLSGVAAQLVHADIASQLLYDGLSTPVLTDITPSWRPAGWTAALAAVDGLAFMGADQEVLHRFSHVPNFSELVVRAMCYRLLVHAVHPAAQVSAWRGLARAATVVAAFAER